MLKKIFPAAAFIVLLSSCSTFKPLNFTSNKQVASNAAPDKPAKFINDISVVPEIEAPKAEVRTIVVKNKSGLQSAPTVKPAVDTKAIDGIIANRMAELEAISSVQLKYATLLETDISALPNITLLEAVDEWYGVRYRRGGKSSKGIDCSGFTNAVYATAYGMTIPPVSREQYKVCRKISTTELQEGDLLFFNINGSGVSHVGIYLGNNKFMHASVSRGVRVSGLFESYYMKRFIGAGRIEDKEIITP